MKLQQLTILIFLLIVFSSKAQNFEWAKVIGSENYIYGSSIKVDNVGNIYSSGTFSDTVDFDPGLDTFSIAATGYNDSYIQKLDPSGNLLWIKSLSGTSNVDINSMVLDDFGNVYCVGSFTDTVDFDPGIGVLDLYSAGYMDYFIQKLDSMGNLLWVKTFGSVGGESGTSIALDSSGNVYITGYFTWTVDFDPSIGVINLTADSYGYYDIFMQKLDSSGNLLWAKSCGGAYDDVPVSMSVDYMGNIYSTGRFKGITDFDPGPSAFNVTSQSSGDIYVHKMDSLGNLIWVRNFGGGSFENSSQIFSDLQGNVYTVGNFESFVDFDPGVGSYWSSPLGPGGSDIFVQKLNSTGDFMWAKTFGGVEPQETASSVSVDIQGNIYTTGYFRGSVDFDPGAGTNVHSSGTSVQNTFIQKLDSLGNFIWAKSFLDSSGSFGKSITVDPLGNIFTLGIFNQSIDFDPVSGTIDFVSPNGGISLFIHKMSQCLQNSEIDYKTGCDSLTWIDGNTYYSSTNSPTFILQNSGGCDSIVTLNLTILNSSTGAESQIACDLFTWPINGQTYTTSGQYSDTIPNAAGCDSIITLDLTIIPSLPLIIENSFSMPSDANNCLGETAIDLSGNAPFELDFDNGSQVVTSNGYSLVTNLCPGVHDLHVTDNCGDTLSTTIVIPVDSNYVFNNPFIDSLAQDSLGVTLTNCDIYYAGIDTAYIDSIWATGNTVNVIWNIVDSNGSNLDTTSYILNNGNGVYWLQLSVFCPFKSVGEYFTVTEAIYFNNGHVSTAGLTDFENKLFEIYPNPTNDQVHINFSGSNAELTVYDAQGKMVLKDQIQNQEIISLQNFERGVYLFEFNNSNGRSVQRVVKQ